MLKSLPVRVTLRLLFVCSISLAQENIVRVDIDKARMEIRFYREDIVRIRVAPSLAAEAPGSLSVIALPGNLRISRRDDADTVRVATDSLRLSIAKKNGAITFRDRRGLIILKAEGLGKESFDSTRGDADRNQHVKQWFTLTESEGLYGLGQFEDALVNYRGQDMLIGQANRTAVNPFLVSTNGYGILWDNPSLSRFSDSRQGAFFWAEAAGEINYYFVFGPEMDNVVAGYRYLTGKAPMLGKWAYGFWQSKERYKTSAEVVDIVREHRKRGIPFDNIVQDWSYWGGNDQFSGMIWDTAAYPHPAAMIDTLHALNAHIMVSIWPAFGPKSDIFHAMAARGFLFPVPHWNQGRVYDAFNPEARDLYWSYLKKGLFDQGVDAFWMDATEPEFRCSDDRYITALSMKSAGTTFLGPFSRVLNAYSLMTTKGVYEHQRATTDKKRALILTRSSFAGQQRYAAATWSGDTFASWDDLRVQIAAGLNFSMSGIPYWTHDIGGFITDFHFPQGLADPAYKELYVRWFQFGGFSPLFRSHGTNIPREIWRFGNKGEWAYDALVDADRLRYRLMPYIYSVAWRVFKSDYSFIRGLPMDFPQDRNTYALSEQFMFGPSLMVCPVTRPMQFPPAFNGVDITPNHFYSMDGTEHGLLLQIYRGTSFDSLLMARKTDVGQISWTGCLPLELDTAYSLRMEGRLASERTGRHVFFVITDGGVKLWWDSTLVIDAWNNAVRTTLQFSANLTDGVKHAFRLEHRQFKQGDALLKINWQRPESPFPGKNSVNVYLPRNKRWFDFWTGTSLDGGQTVTVEAPINRIPLFVPAGSIVPVGPEVEYASQRTSEPVELRIYPGRDADFVLYDDEGDNYNYEKGNSVQIPLHWDDSRKVLVVGDQQGNFSGAPTRREFTVVLVAKGHGVGQSTTPSPESKVRYLGKAVTVRP